jgi:hypothetical protein
MVRPQQARVGSPSGARLGDEPSARVVVEVDGPHPVLSRPHGATSSRSAGHQRVTVSVRRVASPLVSSALMMIRVVPRRT